MRRVLIVGAGRENPKAFLKDLSSQADLVIGVDKGAETLFKNGIKFGLAVGDFDSLTDFAVLKDVKKLTYSREKDSSDTELAINYGIKEGFDEFVLTQMIGKRTDHMLFNVSMLVKLLKSKKISCIKEEKEEIYILDSKISLSVLPKATVSLFPVSRRVTGVNTKGLKYPLRNGNLYLGQTLTLSNIAVSREIEITVEKGILLVLIEKI